ncbi:MAG: hypothetical protein H6670_16115 [Anaerolineaceae bacterium]|nr:hypothetical protein [Anaerolineaceae bacterium]
MQTVPGAGTLNSDRTGGRWITTTTLVGPESIGGQIDPGVYHFTVISDDGARMC